MQSDISKVLARHELSFREKILGCFSKPVSCPEFVFSFLFVLWTGPFSFLRRIFSAADETTVMPCGANGENGEENLTGPIRLRPQNGTAVWKVNIQKSLSDHVIQNTRHCRAGSQAVKPVCPHQCQFTWNARKQQRTFLPLLAGLFYPLVILENSFSVFSSLFYFCFVPFSFNAQMRPSSLRW